MKALSVNLIVLLSHLILKTSAHSAENGNLLQSVHDIASQAGASGKAITRPDGTNTLLFNQFVFLRINPTNGFWDAAWLRAAETAISHAGFALEWNGKIFGLEPATIEVRPFTNQFGTGLEARQISGESVEIERILRIYDGKAALILSAKIHNRSAAELSLGVARLVHLFKENGGGWQVGQTAETPAAVHAVSSAHWASTPWQPGKTEETYTSAGLLALASRKPPAALAFGFLTAREARPDLSAKSHAGEGGTMLLAHQPFLERKLAPGETLEFDSVYLCAGTDPFEALEKYGEAVAAFAPAPIRNRPTALWCSWYAHRMSMSEDLVLANAAVAALHFKPLGFEIIQLDHGWERGDVTGDWTPNERFPHGLKWLADELKSRYGFRLGLWIAPTDVAETSDTFKQHPDWMLKDQAGHPLVNWRWYWKPNPNCYELDASDPAAAKHIETVFRQLTADGADYFKIDFIAASAGEQFFQADPKVTRGWGVLRKGMEAIRRGAGTKPTIRYCQTPSLLSAGLADSAYGGGDTLDAGLNGDITVLRENAQHLAASYWANERLYRRKVCDLSVRMQADVEEVRMRLAIMTLAGCSISFSDELQYLPASRIRMMQACLPPGNPPMKPLDLFDRALPSLWHIHCTGRDGTSPSPLSEGGEGRGAEGRSLDEWDVVGVFNFEHKAEERLIDFAALGLPADTEAAVFEFWEEKFLGVHREKLSLMLPPQSSRILSVRRLINRPQLIGTDMHLLQGFHELKRLGWNEKTLTLAGEFERMAGLTGKAFIYVPTNYTAHFDFPLGTNSAHLTHLSGRVWAHEIKFASPRLAWSLPFDKSPK